MKFRIGRMESSGESVLYQVASDKIEAEQLLEQHWQKQNGLGNNPSQIDNNKFKFCSEANKCYTFYIEEINLEHLDCNTVLKKTNPKDILIQTKARWRK